MVEIRRYTYEFQRNYYIKTNNKFARLRVSSPNLMIVPPQYFEPVEIPAIKWQHATSTDTYEIIQAVFGLYKKYSNEEIF